MGGSGLAPIRSADVRPLGGRDGRVPRPAGAGGHGTRIATEYPHLVAAALGVTDFRDPSCSGADTGDMANAQNVNPGPNPPQLDRLDAGTQLVTLRIGGNDIGFSEIIQNCASLTPTGPPLNGVLADVAAANGAAFVDAYTASIGHDACRLLGVRWVEPAIPASPGAPVHPKLFGV